MDFFRFDGTEELCKGALGIPEPTGEDILNDDFDKTVIIMPGSAFSHKRDRIGYGGGYYDRYLSLHPECITIAAAYDFQVLDNIPADEHDIKPQMIVTESRIII